MSFEAGGFLLNRKVCNTFLSKRILYAILCLILIISPIGLYYGLRSFLSQQGASTLSINNLSSYITSEYKENYYSFENDQINFGYKMNNIYLGVIILNDTIDPNIDIIAILSTEIKINCTMEISDPDDTNIINFELWELLDFDGKLSWNDLETDRIGIKVATTTFELEAPIPSNIEIVFNDDKLASSFNNGIRTYIVKIQASYSVDYETIYFSTTNNFCNSTITYSYVPMYLNYIIYGISASFLIIAVIFAVKSYVNGKKFTQSNCKKKN